MLGWVAGGRTSGWLPGLELAGGWIKANSAQLKLHLAIIPQFHWYLTCIM